MNNETTLVKLKKTIVAVFNVRRPSLIVLVALVGIVAYLVTYQPEPHEVPLSDDKSTLLQPVKELILPLFRKERNLPPPPKDWIVPPPPAKNTPVGWLERASKAQAEYDQDQQILHRYPELKEKFQDQVFSMGEINKETVAKLIDFGERSIKPCLFQLVYERPHFLATAALAGLGPRAVEPLLKTMAENPARANEVIEAFQQMDENPAKELVRLACMPGPARACAIRTLAFFVNKYDHANEASCKRDSCALAHPGALTGESRQPLLAQLKGDQNAEVRHDLLVVQRYYKSPDGNAIKEISALLDHDPDERVRAAAAEALGSMLEVSTVRGSPIIIKALGKAIADRNADSVKAACACALWQAHCPVDQSVIRSLRKASESPSDNEKEMAMQALCYLALYNKECIPDLVRALESKSYPTVSTAVDTCCRLGPPSWAANRRLKEIAGYNIFGLRPKALEAIRAINPGSNSYP